ncbi:MAG: FprA family A-type flavoprotein [Candidatus Delongbacteria bacterium]|jgi:flavorubredoxin|nr:FprA family A-type flavoprotein [Candidatus Delongbacteria bacterium]
MAVRKLTPNVHYVGAIDWDRKIFDELIPLPDGTSYNAYIVKGSEKTALIDSVDPEKEMELLANLHELGIEKLDYIVTNHAEQDHSGAIPLILEHFPEAVVVTNQKCKSFEIDHLYINDSKFKVINDGDTLSLGDKTLKFIMTPWVHWPETMVTYLEEDNILFSCDFFGSHFASSKLFAEENPKVIEGAKRYYAEIMMPFRSIIRKNIEKLADLDIKMIAPSHGPIWQSPSTIIEAYKEWISEEVKNEVIIPYVSMHESTLIMVDYLVDELIKKEINVKPFNLPKTDVGELAMSLVDAATVIVATPTVLAGAHPAAVYATFLMNALRPKTKFVGIIGSYGWGGKMVEQLKGLLGNLKIDLLDPVLVKGRPAEDDFKELDKLIETIVEKHKSL